MQNNQETLGFLNLAANDILVQVANKEIDLNALAKELLTNIDFNTQGKW